MIPALSTAEPNTAPDCAASAAQAIAAFLLRRQPVLALTGAGCSTASGIPDYRDRDGNWKRAEPIRYQRFVKDPAARRRYWARSFVGWPRVAASRPSAAHLALASLERGGFLTHLITQNVDGLHQRAGSRRVLDLHGRLDVVDCLDCGARLSRADMQESLRAANPRYAPVDLAEPSAPDGDVLLSEALAQGLHVPACSHCGGLLKPGVVFFGENVPRPRVGRALERLGASGGLIVVGSSLTVFSGYRFCVRAARDGIPIALVNLGRTRADPLASLKVDAECGSVLRDAVYLLNAGA